MRLRLLVPVVAALAAACSSPQPFDSGTAGVAQGRPAATASSTSPATPPADRKYLLERVDDASVVQLYADGFSALPLKEKVLIWHLYEAALAGRDIFIDQKHRSALEMRGVIEQIVAHPQGVDAATLADIQRYAKLFWINNGPYNNLTARKFVLTCTPQALAAAGAAAVKNGARFATSGGESTDALFARLQPMFFDPAVDPIVTNKNPAPGQDILQASANNLYSGVSLADLKGFTEKYGLNSRLVKQNGRLVEEVYRLDGKYGTYIAGIIKHLDAAQAFADPPMAKALAALVKFYRTGEVADREAYDIAWVQDTASPVDTINGFIEVYLDPRGIKGGWEALVFYVNQEKTGRIKMLATNAQWFEDRMPWDPKYRKPNVQGIVANAIDVVVETGDSGPVTPIGINLPNDQAIREKYGSKSVALSNVTDASNRATPGTMRSEFSWTPDEAERATKFAEVGASLTTDMHEVIGHGSGRQAEGKGNPQALIKEHFSALEEGRADLVGLYFIADPKLVELGVVPAADHDNIVRAEYESYTRNALVQLRRVREGTQIEEDHMRNRQMIVRWLMANTKAIEERTRDGKTYLVMVDPKAFREGVGRLLADVQRIKSEGDAAAARKLFDTYGVHFDPKLRDQVVGRVQALNLPSYTGFVMPKLTPVTSPDGKITDVTISYPMDLTRQMLEYSGVRRDKP
ncbi:MAG: peptidase M49 [Acidobacteria bacterium RIFCSPLOWO2_12_FULL_67_14b]|nr:MAG: peptidase M49 [Acidobacteria bacterium RIFCSPLOWO2_12_FULL_67_14b]